MTKPRLMAAAASLSLLVVLFAVLPSLGADQKDKVSRDTLYRPLGLFTEVLSLVRSNYVEKVEVKPLLAGAFAGVTDALDAFSEYVPPEKMAAFEAARAAQEKGSVVDAGLVLARRVGYPIVVAAVPGSPAAAAGVRSDDILERVGDRSVRGLGLWEVQALVSGPPGGKVRVYVVRDARPRHRWLEIVRSSWTPALPSVSRASGETVVTVPTFGSGTSKALAALLSRLDPEKPIVIDVRGNAWGTFAEAASAAGLLVPPGPMGELKGRKIETTAWKAEPGERIHKGRVAVLVDSGTGGPAELFAAVLHEAAAREAGIELPAATARFHGPATDRSGTEGAAAGAPTEGSQGEAAAPPPPVDKKKLRVRLVGEPTFGMGISQQVIRLASGGALHITVGKVRTPAGRALSPRGVEPDDRVWGVTVDETPGAAPVPDAILQRGLKVLVEAAEPAKTPS